MPEKFRGNRGAAEETARGDELRAATDATGERERLWRLVAIARGLGGHETEAALLEAVADAALALAEAERAFVVLLGDGERPRVEAARNFDREEVREADDKISRTVVDRVIASGEPLLVDEAGADGRLGAQESVQRLKLRSVLCVPLRLDARNAGALYVENRFRGAAFGATERRLLEALAAQVGAALEVLRARAAAERRRARAEEEASAFRGAAESQRIELSRLATALANRREDGASAPGISAIVGRSPAIRKVLAVIDRISGSEVPVLVTGESGTGKELVARAIHLSGPRREGPFVSENFAALPEPLVESELFGHVRGAFTGADADRAGLFEAARGGTLFLDEVADMPLSIQKKLLRVLQEGELRPLGGDRAVKVDARIVAATHRNLAELVRRGEFREDLFYRLCVLEVKIPNLRERAEDIPDLVAHFLAGAKGITREAVRALARRAWPGNVRELGNAVRRLAALGGDPIVEADVRDLLDPAPVRAGRGAAPLQTLEEIERAHVERVLAAAGGRPVEAAKTLGISYTTLWRKMKKWGLTRGGRGPEGA